MLWDMARYANYDVDSPYNRAASYWARSQTQFRFPIDARPLRDRITPARRRRVDARPVTPFPGARRSLAAGSAMPQLAAAREPVVAELVFVDDEIVDAEIVAEDRWQGKSSDVLYIG